MKRILSFLLVLIIIASIIFQCSLNSYAVIGIDDAILIGTIVLDLASLGITIYSVADFCKSPAFKDFCKSLGDGVETGVRLVKRNGVLFFATVKTAWEQICGWVKSKFSGRSETKQIEFDIEQSTEPTSLTLRDGTVVPYGMFMRWPFFIYRLNGAIRAIACDGREPGMAWGTSLIQIFCEGHGQVIRYDLTDGEWDVNWSRNMTYGLTYRGVTGSFFNLDFGTSVHADKESFYLYRTMQLRSSGGTDLENAPPETVPDGTETTTGVVTASSDGTYYPGMVDAPADVIADDDLILIPVPDQLVVDGNTDNPTLTLDLDVIAQTLAEAAIPGVQTYVLTGGTTNTTVDYVIDPAVSETVDGVVADTDVPAMEGTGTAADDISTANKFRLPKSFLEGFPFSIPYSIYVGIQSLVSSPQAPVFDFPFSIPQIGINQNIHVDLSKWDSVARICRALLSVVWVAGLAMACNKFIKR